MERFKNYINGQWVEPKSNKYFKNINPADLSDIVGEFPESGQEDVNDAVAAAKEAFAKWKKMPAPTAELNMDMWSFPTNKDAAKTTYCACGMLVKMEGVPLWIWWHVSLFCL